MKVIAGPRQDAARRRHVWSPKAYVEKNPETVTKFTAPSPRP